MGLKEIGINTRNWMSRLRIGITGEPLLILHWIYGLYNPWSYTVWSKQFLTFEPNNMTSRLNIPLWYGKLLFRDVAKHWSGEGVEIIVDFTRNIMWSVKGVSKPKRNRISGIKSAQCFIQVKRNILKIIYAWSFISPIYRVSLQSSLLQAVVVVGKIYQWWSYCRIRDWLLDGYCPCSCI